MGRLWYALRVIAYCMWSSRSLGCVTMEEIMVRSRGGVGLERGWVNEPCWRTFCLRAQLIWKNVECGQQLGHDVADHIYHRLGPSVALPFSFSRPHHKSHQ